ncbi:hypothetical protein GCM10010411_01930 [Actinomadura fulvescens]|uniref:Uncharacterized protein n=1 Tax=Actinomadura fulvescens TaxID=46160 RepID=A0ABN3PD43_9ACTN
MLLRDPLLADRAEHFPVSVGERRRPPDEQPAQFQLGVIHNAKLYARSFYKVNAQPSQPDRLLVRSFDQLM